MIKFLAVIAFCVNDQCGFWAKTDQPYYTQEECQIALIEGVKSLVSQGVNPDNIVPGCIPTSFYKKEA